MVERYCVHASQLQIFSWIDEMSQARQYSHREGMAVVQHCQIKTNIRLDFLSTTLGISG